MSEPDRISDQEFLDQLVERLKSSGHRLVFVDRGLIQFSKVASAFLGLFLLIGITFFGLDFKEAADELAKTRSEIQDGRTQLKDSLAEAKDMSKEISRKSVEIEEKLTAVEYKLVKAENLVRDSFNRSLISLTSVVAETVPYKDIGILRDFYRTNLTFAKEKELNYLRIEYLRRLAVLEWFDSNRNLSRSLFHEAIEVALEHQEELIAAEILTREGQFELSIFHEEGQVAVAKAKRLFHRALMLFQTTGDITGQGEAFRSIGEAHRLEGNVQQALEFFGRARQTYLSGNRSERDELLALSLIADTHRELGHTADAAEYYSESVSIAEALHEYHFASEFALELAKLQEKGASQLTYLCTASQYFELAPQPKSSKKFERKVMRIDPSFDRTTACARREE